MFSRSKITRKRRLVGEAAALAVVVAVTIAPAKSADTGERRAVLEWMLATDQKIFDITYKLATAHDGLCSRTAILPGFSVHERSQYAFAYRETLTETFGMGAGIYVLSVASGSPAESAGLRVGDELLSLDDLSIPDRQREANARHNSINAKATAIRRDIAERFADGEAEVHVARDGVVMSVKIAGAPGCRSDVHLRMSSKPEATSDGRNIIVSSSLAVMLGTSDLLAAAIAHEMAHNALGHSQQFAAKSPSRRCRKLAETEADRMSVHLLANARYDPTAAMRLWGMLGSNLKGTANTDFHPSQSARIANIKSDIMVLSETRSTQPKKARFLREKSFSPGGECLQ